jgi:hypothetical protein
MLERGMILRTTLVHFDSPLRFYGDVNPAADKMKIGYVNEAYHNETFEDAFVNY